MAQSATMPGDPFDWNLLLPAAPPSVSFTSVQLEGKRVLITGAGGSIGSALASSVWASAPAGLVLLDTSENGLYQIDRSLRDAGSLDHVASLGSVCDRDYLERVFRVHRPQLVFHAAALKHVPLMERNPFAAITHNAVGTLNLAKAAVGFRAERVVLVSTDKAVDPSSIMGASKRIAELALLAVAATTATRMSAVRLGNVAGSQGSVLPLFLDQMARGGPLTVTHADAHRYFISMDRAVAALIAALEWEASPALLVPALGLPLRIADLARRLVEMHGSKAPIEFTGLRPGDKMTESLVSSGETWAAEPSGREGLRGVVSRIPAQSLVEATMNRIQDAVRKGDLARLLQAVATLVPEYQPSNVLQAQAGMQIAATEEAPA